MRNQDVVEATTMRKAVEPSRLNKFIDLPGARNADQVLSRAQVNRKTQMTSWDRQKCDKRPFYRLEPTPKTVVTKDLRAVPLDATCASGLQTMDVRVRDSPNDVGGKCPRDMMAPVLATSEGYNRAPEIEYKPVPSSIYLQEGIMTPKERRERQHFITQYHQAQHAIQRANKNAGRLKQLITTRHVNNDVMGTEERPNEATRMRGLPFERDLLSHDPTKIKALKREYQSKSNRATPNLNNHERLFCAPPTIFDEMRALKLRNEASAGRPFDIVNGGVITHYAPSVEEKQHPRQAHPSIVLHPYTK